MTVQTVINQKNYNGDGVTTQFPVPFRFLANSHIVVSLQPANPSLPVVSWTEGSDYTISGARKQEGGTVTSISGAPPDDSILIIRRVVPLTQLIDYRANDPFPEESAENGLDQLTMAIQQVSADIGRSLRLPYSFSEDDAILPSPVGSGFLTWDDSIGGFSFVGPIDPTDLSIASEAMFRQQADQQLQFADQALAGRINGYNGLPYSTTVGLYTAAQNNALLDVSGSLAIPETDGNLSSYFDTVLRGSGRVTGLYRKNVIPYNAPAFSYSAKDMLPKHAPQLQAATAPVVVLVGDSISTYYANSNANVQAMLTETLRTEIRKQMGSRSVTFYDRGIGGTTYTDLDGTPSLAVYPEWYTNTSASWLSYIQALNPDVVIFSFGMNPNSGIRAAIDSIMAKMNAWSKIPDRVFCTNLVPNPSSGHNVIEEQEARDRSAGLIRSYARRNGFGLLDFHRAMCMARDGFDPTQGYIQQRNPLTASGNNFPAQSFSTVGFSAQLVIDSTKIPAQGATYQPVTVKYGYGSEESLHIFKDIDTGTYRIRLYYGNSVYGDAGVLQVERTVSLNVLSGQLVLKVERYGTNIAVFDMVGAYNSGEHRDPVFEEKLISMGGRFQFIASGTVAGALISTDFGQAYPALNVPTIKSNDLYGRPISPNPNGEFGGSGFNHPSSLVADAVYRPVLATSQFAGDFLRRYGNGFEQYEAVVDGQRRVVTRNYGRLAISITAAGTFNWSVALPVALATKVLNCRCGLGSVPGTTTVCIYTNTSLGGIGAQANATGSYTTTSTSGVLLIDWEVEGY